MKNPLSIFPLFSSLSEEERSNIEDFCQEKMLDQWEYLFQEGDEPLAIYIVASWSFSVIKESSKREIAVIKHWEMIGEMAFFGSESVRNASVIAREPSEVIVLLMFSLTEIFNKYPSLKTKLTDLVHVRQEYNLKQWVS